MTTEPSATQAAPDLKLAAIHPPIANRLLCELPDEVKLRLFPHLELIELKLGQVISEAGSKLRYVYFPTDSIISLLYVMENGASAEIAVVGNDGMVGVALFMGGESTTSRAVVQSAGFAYRLFGQRLKDEFNRHGALLHLLLRYSQVLLTQMAQTAVCNRHHSIEQQLCRWLLLSIDRLPNDHVLMTQELIANMLGVRREGVTDAAGKLQRLGIINYSRGHIEVIDRALLEKNSCECYGVVLHESERLMPRNHCCKAR
ncbi:Crp/Fnr family transcriptional regulator [Rheinheimera texasensis]|uniref:Crp/Fnr family transcriptional regulator n=1 Tax=Rheinheimera texasensis TaxID=306205 RepID=UPI0032B10467